MQPNSVNYYKGVLLCSRPNEAPAISQKKQFCARVSPHEQIGLVPVKHFDQKKTKKRVLPVLNNHKMWLEKFKKQIKVHKQDEEKQKEIQEKRLEKIKQQGHEQREKMKSSIQNPVIEKKPEEQKVSKHLKKDKPAWAQTAKQKEQDEQKQIDDLLNYFEDQSEEKFKDYMSDNDVKHIMVDLKKKIEKIKEEENWKNKRMEKMKEDKDSHEQQEDKDDVISRMSGRSGSQSVSSQKTAERVQELEKKKKDKQWDSLTTSDKKSMSSVDQQIAKNIADEVLRNYPALKHHSNQSIRQLIEKHAHDQIKA